MWPYTWCQACDRYGEHCWSPGWPNTHWCHRRKDTKGYIHTVTGPGSSHCHDDASEAGRPPCAEMEGSQKQMVPNTGASSHESKGCSSNSSVMIFFPSGRNRRARFVLHILLWPLEGSLGKSYKTSWKFWNESLSLPSNFPVQTKTLCSLGPTLPFTRKAVISQFSFLWQNSCQLITTGLQALNPQYMSCSLIAWP